MKKSDIQKLLEDRILVLDGGLGTMIQSYNLQEEDYRGEEFKNHTKPLKGCNDLLVLTAPEVIAEIHRAYLDAGADIISTDTFNATTISMADYDLQNEVYRINHAAAQLARQEADFVTAANPSKPRLVAGSMGPTNRTASMSSDVNNPASRDITFDDLYRAYTTQARALIDGGADLLLVETVFDTLNAKAAIFAIETLSDELGYAIPVMISGTITDRSGRTLSGQTVEAFYASIRHAELLSVGFNCAFGAKLLRPYLARLSQLADCPVSVHPNAGLPNVMGGYDETPQMMAHDVEEYLKEGLLNIVGGCCGTTPRHIELIAALAAQYPARKYSPREPVTTLSGLEPLKITGETNFVNVGERANVAGSAKFARLIREGNYEEALSVARGQVEAGAQVVDVCMDDGMIDGSQAMTRFLNYAMSEPDIARVPIMIDSSSWEVLEAGLKCVQGKSIVNSISLKEGEAKFLEHARLIHRYGAAVVVMLFDERGQADRFDRKIEVARRAYDLLISIGFPAEDIIFDPNILSIATGIEEHNSYGHDFIEACRWIKANLPHALVSGGVSNLSFSFRGNNPVREAMHSVFLYHAIQAGMDMGIVNPAMLQIYSDIEPELLDLCQDAVLNRRADATERLIDYAERIKASIADNVASVAEAAKWRTESLERRISYAMVKGIADYIEDDTMEAYERLHSPLVVIDTMFMPAMAEVGDLFSAGKMFLPQVVKSARVMKRAVAVLTPYIEQGKVESSGAGRVLVATVKGDVHDIGKNIVAVVMSCNGYQIEDLGVMVECDAIVDRAVEWGADVIGLSGLITPSLDEMRRVVEELERRGLRIPVIIGGATTSAVHTAVKLAPKYSGAVIHSRDASENIRILSALMGAGREAFLADLHISQLSLREAYERREAARTLLPIQEARARKLIKTSDQVRKANKTGRFVFDNFPIKDVVPYIDWNFFFPSWGLKGHFPEILDSTEKGEQARKLYVDALEMLELIEKDGLLTLNGVVGIYRATSDGDNIIVQTPIGTSQQIACLRNQEPTSENLSLSDYVYPKGDYVGAFALTSGIGLDRLVSQYKAEDDDYKAIMAKLLADRLAEAFGEAVHRIVRRELWGYETSPELTLNEILANKYQGVRVAFGYPACPDHSLKQDIFELLEVDETLGMSLTENYMIAPGESICGLIFDDSRSRYFSIGRISNEQVVDYALRRRMSKEEIERLISQHL